MTRAAKPKSDWSAKAERVGERIARTSLHPAVLAWAAQRRKSDVWSVAFSGGSDSLALLLLLWAHWPDRREKLVALHFNHRLRGRESTADERFCQKVCAALGIRLEVGRWTGRNKGASEAEARAARHQFFAIQLKALKGRALWLAHQQDDIAETLLMRLARGSGLGGLSAPRPVQVMGVGRVHLRPLLSLKKRDLVKILRGAGVEWHEDASNATELHFRNRVRHKVLPAWVKSSGRDALAGAARSRELLEEDDTALEDWAGRLAAVNGNGKLDVSALTCVPRAVTRRVLHRWLLEVRPGTDLSRQGFDLLLGLVERGKPNRFSLGLSCFAVISQGHLSLKRG